VTTQVYLVRHAKAGSRSRWEGSDRVRPLTDKGRRQADAIAARLVDAGVERILTSPYTRCWETVQPLASKLGLLVEESPGLEEGQWLTTSLAVFEDACATTAVLCSHGDVIGDLLMHLERSGVDLGADPKFEKGSIWTFTVDDGRITGAAYELPSA
jgi:8-oxo-dGTP diphosphatase